MNPDHTLAQGENHAAAALVLAAGDYRAAVANLSRNVVGESADPVDDLPPATVVTHVGLLAGGKLVVRGTTADNGKVVKVLVNGQTAKAVTANFAEWEAVLEGLRSGEVKISAHAEDEAGNVEKRPHAVAVRR